MTEAAAAVFKVHLTKQWSRKNLPHNFDHAVGQAPTLQSGETGRIFIETGFKAWLAYFLAGQGKGKNYRGRAADLQAIAAFNRLPDEKRKSVATELLNTQAHPTVQVEIEKLSKRRESGKPYRDSRYYLAKQLVS